MNDTLIELYSNLELEEKSLKRALDIGTSKSRQRIFDRLKEIKKEKNKIKFKLRLEREIWRNEKFR